MPFSAASAIGASLSPIYYKDGIPTPLPERELPLRLPEIDSFKPVHVKPRSKERKIGHIRAIRSKPAQCRFAGSSAYYLRYMDPHNNEELVSAEANKYWRNVDLYVGGTEHAVGHLIYSRFWNKFLYDHGYVCEEEPFKNS